ncbi:MAG: OprO/OprP family phosphate-selective porin [Planctomycetota bacterium]|jgi:phosphate-selective porin OprO/OprP
MPGLRECPSLALAWLLCGPALAQDPGQVEQEAPDEERITLTGPPDFPLEMFWLDGPQIRTPGGEFILRPVFRFEYDFQSFDADDDIETAFGSVTDTAKFRRRRFGARGSIYERIGYSVEFDDNRDRPFLKGHVEVTEIPYLGLLRFGHTSEPFGGERSISGKFTVFMERALTDVLNPRRNTGFLARNDLLDQRMTWSVGVFRPARNAGDPEDSGIGITGRVSGLPYESEDGSELVHAAVAYSYRQFPHDEARFRRRPEASFAPQLVDTGSFDAHYGNYFSVELAANFGSLNLQAEQKLVYVDGNNEVFPGSHAQVSYFLTGEQRPYNKGRGSFHGRVRPIHPVLLGETPGLGAWELAARVSHLDLSDGSVNGGSLFDYTFGINWYLNAHTRFMSNLVQAHRGGVGDLTALTFRLMVDF